MIDSFVKQLTPNPQTKQQQFKTTQNIFRTIDVLDVRPVPQLVLWPYVVFAYFAVNLVPFFAILIIPCSEGICEKYDQKFERSLYSGTISAVISSLLAICLSVFYRYLINERSKAWNSDFWRYIKYGLMTLIIVSSVILGFISAHKINIRNNIEETAFWFYALIIGIFFSAFFLMIGSCIGYYTGFFYDIQHFDVNFAEPKHELSKKFFLNKKSKF
jgi:hypothetical protein